MSSSKQCAIPAAHISHAQLRLKQEASGALPLRIGGLAESEIRNPSSPSWGFADALR